MLDLRGPDGGLSPEAKNIATGAAVGAVLGILPGVSLLGGAIVGAVVATVNVLNRRG
jgi:hypothetical protein